MVLQTTEELKGFGDLQTWAEVVWREMFVLETALRGDVVMDDVVMDDGWGGC